MDDAPDPETTKLWAELEANPDSFENWASLINHIETTHGAISRNSNPQDIANLRDVYDRLLLKYPLFFGYWKKYADHEFNISGPEAAEAVYERAVASVPNSVDIWVNYCTFKYDTSHEPDVIRHIIPWPHTYYERGADCVGLDFLSHAFWDKYLAFEESMNSGLTFKLLSRIIQIPMHQYARYFEKFREMAPSQPLESLVPAEVLAQYRAEVKMSDPDKGEDQMEYELRNRIDGDHMARFHQVQHETTRRWQFEAELKRPYFHVTELDDTEIKAWDKYLDFEEGQGDYTRIVFLYERCLVVTPLYDHFWFRYIRWMLKQVNKVEEVRHIFQRACCTFVPICRPLVRLQYALFEEREGRQDVASEIYAAIAAPDNLPGDLETAKAFASLELRHHGLDAAVKRYRQFIAETQDMGDKASLIAALGQFLWKSKGSAEEPRELYNSSRSHMTGHAVFWKSYLNFEVDQPDSAGQHDRVKGVFDALCKAELPTDAVKDLAETYMEYLGQHGGLDKVKELLHLSLELS